MVVSVMGVDDSPGDLAWVDIPVEFPLESRGCQCEYRPAKNNESIVYFISLFAMLTSSLVVLLLSLYVNWPIWFLKLSWGVNSILRSTNQPEKLVW